ncbi:hypothetical protein H7U19_13695 [Hyunsoonleella sp. SJ7]|uniref:Prenyltransferase n=1 Tax=Hyunsoonleella aquatilis TaxID=2762758 RepID=A0A923HAE5_9FLAO|nr:hypothetical protein [Hyunsoonleella aquatilis]MBC3759468.1 hypothetical protein [Hyunsoonleella aquatilis]
MSFLKQLFNFYINSSIHVALAVYALAWITLLELELDYDENLLYFIFYASITGYNFVKYFGIARFHHRQLADYLKWIQVFSFFCFALMCYYGFYLELKTLAVSLVLSVLTFLYAIPLSSNRKFALRNISGLKVYVIAFTWAGVTVMLPLVELNLEMNADIVLMMLKRFLFIVVLMLPFEIRDLKYDTATLGTLPQKLGLKGAKRLGIFLLILFFVMEFFKDETRVSYIFVLLVIAVITGIFVAFSKVSQGKYYSAFWVEGIPMLWLILLLMFG